MGEEAANQTHNVWMAVYPAGEGRQRRHPDSRVDIMRCLVCLSERQDARGIKIVPLDGSAVQVTYVRDSGQVEYFKGAPGMAHTIKVEHLGMYMFSVPAICL